jgi:hypothetical protein
MSRHHNKHSAVDNQFRLDSVGIKEIIKKYPDKVVEVVHRDRDVVLVLDTCRIVYSK